MFRKITRRNLEQFISKYATEKKVLDVGSGGSSYSRYFPNRLTVDIDRKRNPDIVADAHQLPFKDGEFEFVLSTEMIEHVHDPFQVEKELRRVTRKGGTLILSTRFVFPLHDTPNDYWRYTRFGLLRLFKEWEIIEIQSETRSFSAVGVLLQRICFQSRLKFNRLLKLFLFCLAWILTKMDWLIVKEYGDIGKKEAEKEIMSTGYYMACIKK